MSACRPSETELIAIYRLEFYKKQKNWKICSSRHNKKSMRSVKKTQTLNTTYNIEDNIGLKDLSDPLNVAFLDSEHDKTQKSNENKELKQKERKLSFEWQEPLNIWPNETEEHCQITNKELKNEQTKPKLVENSTSTGCGEKPKRNFAMQRLQELQKAASLSNCPETDQEYKQDEFKSSKLYPQSSEQYTEISENNLELDEICFKWNNPYFCGDSEHVYPWGVHGDILEARYMEQNVFDQDFLERGVINGNDNVVHSEAWPQEPVKNIPVFPPGVFDYEKEVDCSVDSIGEFMRGADCAPHSSELDISLPPSVNIHDVSFRSLSRLSSQQLVLAARKHLHVLRRLFHESEQRQKLRRLSSLSSGFSSFEEYPTRDIGPSVPNNLPKTMYYKDVFVAGSHMNRHLNLHLDMNMGRGRGRLIDAKHRSFREAQPF